MTESVFVDLMSAAITATDSTEGEALTMFELQLLERNDPRLVWELFESVRGVALRRLYRMAQYQLSAPPQASEAQPTPTPTSSKVHDGTASEPETADSPIDHQDSQGGGRHLAVSNLDDRRRKISRSTPRPSPRSQRSAQNVLMDIGGRKSQLDSITNRHGTPVGDLTYYGLANFYDENPVIRAFVGRLMEGGMPKSERQSDVARKFYTPDQADRWWFECLKAVA